MNDQHNNVLDQMRGGLKRGEMFCIGSTLKPGTLSAIGGGLPKTNIGMTVALDMARRGEITEEQLRRAAIEALHRTPFID